MAMYLWTIAVLSIAMFLSDWWFFKKMKEHDFFRWFRWLSLVPLILFVAVLFYIRYGLPQIDNYTLASHSMWVFVILTIIYVPKILYILFFYINRLYNRTFNRQTRVFRIAGFGLGIFFVSVIFYGLIVTRDNFYVKQQVVEVKNLPKGFDGYKIVVFADFHLGNWNNNYSIMHPIIKLINEQQGDILIFAGDMINNFEHEIHGWEPYFIQLKSKTGLKYAILGNHDYGDYTDWDSQDAKSENLEKTKQNIRDLGFRLLLNENEDVVNQGDTLTLVGVENFGSGHFDDYADLPQALKESNPNRLKILISHDPNHWNAEITSKHPEIFLTIAGHTHAGQLGFVRNGFKVSPASLVYPQWDGLYKHKEQYLYVNRGIGVVGIPLRIGVPPEITVIELKRGL
ncbi:MAG: metallophosphoesterase [Paludibacteraceae bacterium]